MVALATAYQLPPEEPDDPRDGKMSFLDHLDEIRTRLIRVCVAVAAGMVIAFFFIDRLVAFVLAPMRRVLPAGANLIYTRSRCTSPSR
jgi:sec-independent protein translocase protein TatC